MHEYTRLWVISCLLFLTNILCEILIFSEVTFLGIQLVTNLTGTLTLVTVLKACHAIDNIPYNKFWGMYILLLLFFNVAFVLSKVDSSIIAILFYLYQFLLIGAIAYTILRKWRFSGKIKGSFSLLALAFGMLCLNGSMAAIQGIYTLTDLYLAMGGLVLLNIGAAILYRLGLESGQKIMQDYLYLIAEKAVDILFYYTLTPYPRFVFISPSIEQITGYKQEEFYNNPKLYMELSHEEDRELIAKGFTVDASLMNKKVLRWQRKDGELLYLEFNNTPLFTNDKWIAIEGVIRDVTDRKLAEQEMMDAKRSRQILLSYISHELKTPLTYILGYTEALQKNLFETEEERIDAIKLIHSKSVFLQTLVDDLFQLSKMESNQFSFEFAQDAVYSLFDQLDHKYRNDVVNSKLQYKSSIEEVLLDKKYEVLVDSKRIEQVVSNLLHNAIKNTPENGTIDFSCKLDEQKEVVVFRVKDTGIGIKKEDLPYIFMKFYQGTSSGGKTGSGSGLGLSLSKQIVQAHQGDINVKINKDKGCTFSFTLPLYKEEA